MLTSLAQGPATGHPRGGDIGAMDLGVTVGTSVDKELSDAGSLVDSVGIMALEAEKWHGGVQQGGAHRAMGGMTVGAILGDIPMLEDKRPLFFHMTAGTGLLWGIPLEQFILGRAVGVVAVDAGHLLFPQGMMRHEAVLGLHLGMAGIAELGHLVATNLLPGPLMEFVTVEAADVVNCMGTGIPVGHGRYGGCGMAFKAD